LSYIIDVPLIGKCRRKTSMISLASSSFASIVSLDTSTEYDAPVPTSIASFTLLMPILHYVRADRQLRGREVDAALVMRLETALLLDLVQGGATFHGELSIARHRSSAVMLAE
jgi:hypothetical protein